MAERCRLCGRKNYQPKYPTCWICWAAKQERERREREEAIDRSLRGNSFESGLKP